MNEYNDLLSMVSTLKNKYPTIEITNIDATGQRQNRAVYFFEKKNNRFRNVFLEVWYSKPSDKYTFVLFRPLFTSDEELEASMNPKFTINRGEIYRYHLTKEEVLTFVASKLNLVCEEGLLRGTPNKYFANTDTVVTLVGSPEWFNRKAQDPAVIKHCNRTEDLRFDFLEKYAPDKLADLSGKSLLENAFGQNDSMMQFLWDDYSFGTLGSQGKLGFLYKMNNRWRYNENNNAEFVSDTEAIDKGEEIKNNLLYCIDAIKGTDLNSLEGYKILDDKLSVVKFSTYTWALKYYQMCFPQFFPGMYSDPKIKRALRILGLPDHGNRTARIMNLGELALFIRRCKISNLLFGKVFGDEWGWDNNISKPMCPAGSMNYESRNEILEEADLSFYRFPSQKKIQDEKEEAFVNQFEEELDNKELEGKERLAVVKSRINQGVFREKLLKRYNKCCLCGVSDPHFLVASHIKPWAECEANERLDIDNGFLLCPGHDKLFDLGFISFDSKGQVLISEKLQENEKTFLNIHEGKTIELNDGNRKYLEFHRKMFGFEGWLD